MLEKLVVKENGYIYIDIWMKIEEWKELLFFFLEWI